MDSPPLRCPCCRAELIGVACRCGFAGRVDEGVVDVMTSAEERAFREFLAHYRRVRDAEAWGGDDLDLPFRPLRHREVWNVRRRTFRRMERLVKAVPRRGAALDAAAGNCWLAAHLARWGFCVTAMDINADGRDGLGAARYYLDRGLGFRRVRAPVEAIPFHESSFDLVIVSGAVHYLDRPRALAELRRVMKPDGRAIVYDSPWYERRVDGERGVRQMEAEHARRYGIVARGSHSSFLVRDEWNRDLETAGFAARHYFPWTGIRRTWASSKARLKGQRMARFPIVLLRTRDA